MRHAGLCLALLLAGCASPGQWTRVEGSSGPIWRSDRATWRAEVDPARGRLTSLGPIGGRNLLFEPTHNELGFGGHRVWLGPQTEWEVFWPPPDNWELSAADRITVLSDGSLSVLSPSAGSGAPALHRNYRWVADGRLECVVEWTEARPGGRQAIQIFQIASGAAVEAEARPESRAPHGYVLLPLLDRPQVLRKFRVPPHVRRTGRRVILERAATEEKFGFVEQPLLARWPDRLELILHPGPSRGVVVDDPSEGYPTQVYLGSDAWPLIEIEQLSPRLRPEKPDHTVSHTVTIELNHRSEPTPSDFSTQ